MSDDGEGEDPLSREEISELSAPELRGLLATTESSRTAARCIRELPVKPEEGSVASTVEDVIRVLEDLEQPPLYAAAEYANRVGATDLELLLAHPTVLETVLREGTVGDDNYIRTAVGPVRALAREDPSMAVPFVGDVVAMLDREPTGHEGATTLLRTLKTVQFGAESLERTADELDRLPHPEPQGAPEALVEHSASVADTLARQRSPRVHHTTTTAREAAAVLHGIAVTEPATVTDDYHLRQVGRALREFDGTSQQWMDAFGVLAVVLEHDPSAVVPHVEPIVGGIPRSLERAGDSEIGPTPRNAVRKLGVVVRLAEHHPELTATAARWARLQQGFRAVGEEAVQGSLILLRAVTEGDVTEDRARALLLELVAIAAERGPGALAPYRDEIAPLESDDDSRVQRAAGRALRAIDRGTDGSDQE